ncbi:MAG: hypothetical protein ACI4EF_00325, partial [Coprococcus sp.]
NQFDSIKKAMDMANLMNMMNGADNNDTVQPSSPSGGTKWDNPPPPDNMVQDNSPPPADMMDSIMDLLADYDYSNEPHDQ